MRRILLCLTVVASIAVAASAQFRDTRLNDLLDRREIGWTEAAAAALLSEALGWDTAMLFESSRPYGTVYDLGPGYWMARECGVGMHDVHRLKRQGMGWGEVAKRLGMHPKTFNKMRKSGCFERDGFWQWLATSHYGYKSNPWDAGRRDGLRHGDIFVAAVLGRGDYGVFRAKCKPGGWDDAGRKPGKRRGKGKRDDD